jgi:hypothetical protein
MFENLVLTFVGFGLGIFTTIITQVFLRRLRYKDARREHQLKQLRLIQEWMEAERDLFHVKFPDLPEFVFCHKYLVENSFYDKKTPEILYAAMKQYLEARKKADDATRKGNNALHSLDNRWFYKIPFVGIRAQTKRDLTGKYPLGFPRKVAPYLSILGEKQAELFYGFPKDVTRSIDWDKLAFIKQPSEIKTIIEPRLNYYGTAPVPNQAEKEAELGRLRDKLPGLRFDAENAIDSILALVEEYEKKWL